MKAQKGYYSLLQFCPDASRLETVNVGVVLFCPETQFLSARIAKSNSRPAKLVRRAELDTGSLNSAKRAIERRLETDKAAFQSLEGFQQFVDTRANALRLTLPRTVKVFDPNQSLNDLFRELVGGKPRETTAEPVANKLHTVFQQLERERRAKLNLAITVPILQKRIEIPYSYQNGVLNLVKPYHFSGQEGQALNTAMRFAIEGDLIYQHGIDAPSKAQLVIVPSFELEEGAGTIEKRVQEVLSKYHVKTIEASQVNAFCDQVLAEAH